MKLHGKTVWWFPKMFNMDPAIPFLRVCPTELKTYVHTKTWPWVFTALFIVVRKWKPPKCLATNEWMDKYGVSLQWDIIRQ